MKDYIMMIGNKGFGIKFPIDEIRKQARGGKGVSGIKVNKRNSHCMKVLVVDNKDELLITSTEGSIIRTSVSDLNSTHRDGNGVKLMHLRDDEEIADAEVINIP